jgi:hypothetical protein
MGISANQARFLSLTARQCDLEYRMQDICRRRTRLSQALTDAATTYNNVTSDRRLFINSVNANTSGTTIGDITHTNLSDNQQYDFITPENLYDNGYYVAIGNELLSINNGDTLTPTGNSFNLNPTQLAATGATGVGDWYGTDPRYKVTAAQSFAASDTGVVTTNQLAATVDLPSNTPASSTSNIPAWTITSSTNNGNGVVTTNYTRNCSTVVVTAGVVGQAAGVRYETIPQISSTNSTVLTNADGLTTEQAAMYTKLSSDLAAAKTANPALTTNDLQIIKYQTAVDPDKDGTYQYQDVISLAIKSTDGLKAIDSICNSADSTTKTNALSSNYILFGDMNLAGYNWDAIGDATTAFSGIFDGNQHEISNMTIDLDGQGDQKYQGLFGNNSGTIKNVNLSDAYIHLDSASDGFGSWHGYVGGIAGMNNNGLVQNCNVENITMIVDGDAEEIGGVVGHNQGTSVIDKSSATGSMTLGSAGDVGGLVGWLNGGTVTSSYSNMNISIAGNVDYGAVLIGDGDGTFTNCYALGSITANGTTKNNFSGGLTGDNQATTNNCYYYNGSTFEVYDNSTGAGGTPTLTTTNVSDFNNSSYFKDSTGYQTINGTSTPVWIFPGETEGSVTNNGSYPILNNSAVNTVKVDVPAITDVPAKQTTTTWTENRTTTTDGATYTISEYSVMNITSEQLEAGLRSGTMQLAQDADMLTQNPVNRDFNGQNIKVELVDWRTAPVISDDLYTANDEEAQTTYEHTITDVNGQDKLLELEQQNIETEYTAITSEKEAVKKVLDNNAQNSFKYFG